MDPPTSPSLSSSWVSTRRPATAMTKKSGGKGGDGWVYEETPSPTPTPPRSPRRLCRPKRWGSLCPKRSHSPDLLPRHRPAEIPNSNPLPFWAIFHEPVHVPANLTPMTPLTSELDTDEGSSSGRWSESDGLTEAYLSAQNSVKKQMLKMGLEFLSSSSSDE